MLYRSSTDAAQVAEKLEQEFKGQRFSAVQCDVTDQERVGVVFEQVIEGFGGGWMGSSPYVLFWRLRRVLTISE